MGQADLLFSFFPTWICLTRLVALIYLWQQRKCIRKPGIWHFSVSSMNILLTAHQPGRLSFSLRRDTINENSEAWVSWAEWWQNTQGHKDWGEDLIWRTCRRFLRFSMNKCFFLFVCFSEISGINISKVLQLFFKLNFLKRESILRFTPSFFLGPSWVLSPSEHPVRELGHYNVISQGITRRESAQGPI